MTPIMNMNLITKNEPIMKMETITITKLELVIIIARCTDLLDSKTHISGLCIGVHVDGATITGYSRTPGSRIMST